MWKPRWVLSEGVLALCNPAALDGSPATVLAPVLSLVNSTTQLCPALLPQVTGSYLPPSCNSCVMLQPRSVPSPRQFLLGLVPQQRAAPSLRTPADPTTLRWCRCLPAPTHLPRRACCGHGFQSRLATELATIPCITLGPGFPCHLASVTGPYNQYN